MLQRPVATGCSYRATGEGLLGLGFLEERESIDKPDLLGQSFSPFPKPTERQKGSFLYGTLATG